MEWIPVQFFCLNRSPTKKLKEDSIWDEKLQRMARGTIQHLHTCKKLIYKLCKQIVFSVNSVFCNYFKITQHADLCRSRIVVNGL